MDASGARTTLITLPPLPGYRASARDLVEAAAPSPGSVVVVDARGLAAWTQGGADELVAALIEAQVAHVTVLEPTARAAQHLADSTRRRSGDTRWLSVAPRERAKSWPSRR